MCDSDIHLQLASSTFDAHVLEIFASLMFGATLVVIHPDGNLDFMYLHKILEKKQMTYILGVPTYLQQLCEFSEKKLDNGWKTFKNICYVGEYH